MSLKGAYRREDAGRPGWAITIVPTPEVVEALKRAVPFTDRTYTDESHVWWISEKYQDKLLAIFGGEFEVYLKQLPLF